MAAHTKLAPKRFAFVQEYIKDLNGTQAAIRAGYSPRSANVTSTRLLMDANVQESIQEYKEMAAKRSQVTVDRTIEEYRRIAFANITDAVHVRGGCVYIDDTDDLTPEQQAAIAEIHQTKDGVRIKFHDKTKALDSLGKHLGMLSDKVQVEHVGEAPKLEIVFRGKPESTEGRPWGQPLKKLEGAPLNLG